MGRRRKHQIKCTPKRIRPYKRGWTPKRIGKVVCAAREDGYTVEALRAEIDKCAPCMNRRRRQRATAEMLAVVRDHSELLDQARTLFIGVGASLGAILLLSRFFAVMRAPSAAAEVLRKEVAKMVRVLAQRKAANDDFYDRLSKEFYEEAA